jgi:hypothetical protein
MAEVLVRDPLALQLSEEAQQEAMGSLAPKIMPEPKSAQDSCQLLPKESSLPWYGSLRQNNWLLKAS